MRSTVDVGLCPCPTTPDGLAAFLLIQFRAYSSGNFKPADVLAFLIPWPHVLSCSDCTFPQRITRCCTLIHAPHACSTSSLPSFRASATGTAIPMPLSHAVERQMKPGESISNNSIIVIDQQTAVIRGLSPEDAFTFVRRRRFPRRPFSNQGNASLGCVWIRS